jgi:metal-dependent amidase/aminoacylase/carboxypeptidase family protein
LAEAVQNAQIFPPLFAGEDFAYYLQKAPGSLWLLGAHQPATGSHHTPVFNPSEEVLWRGVLFWLLLAAEGTS